MGASRDGAAPRRRSGRVARYVVRGAMAEKALRIAATVTAAATDG